MIFSNASPHDRRTHAGAHGSLLHMTLDSYLRPGNARSWKAMRNPEATPLQTHSPRFGAASKQQNDSSNRIRGYTCFNEGSRKRVIWGSKSAEASRRAPNPHGKNCHSNIHTHPMPCSGNTRRWKGEASVRCIRRLRWVTSKLGPNVRAAC